jgi:hypothetical protein
MCKRILCYGTCICMSHNTQAMYRQATRNSHREWRYHMLHVYNCIFLKMSTWDSKHVEEINILWINNNQCTKVGNYYIVPIILHENLQRGSQKDTSVTWLHILRKQTNTGMSTDMTAGTYWTLRTRLRAVFLPTTSAWLADVTCAWSWRLCGINRTIRGLGWRSG